MSPRLPLAPRSSLLPQPLRDQGAQIPRAHRALVAEDVLISGPRALHAALQFKTGTREIHSEDYARNLELQAQVDTYLVLLLFVAFFRKTQRVSRADRRWLRFHLFEAQTPGAFRDQNLRARYLETTKLAASYTRYLDTINGLRRLEEIRQFRSLDYGSKKTRILALMDASPK